MKNQFYSNRYLSWKWLIDVRNDYINQFSLLDISNLNEEIYIGVYGPTQVGKTTFILNLLGLKETVLDPFSKALRGKQKIGESATISATVFKRSEDNKFYVVRSDIKGDYVRKKICDLLELEEEFQKIRKEITTGQIDSLEEIIIYIPSDYFEERHESTENFSIVDLPGDDTKDSSEEEHVNNTISKYMNLCKLVLIMELASNINSLSQISLDSIQKWYKFEHKFCIVVTRAVSDSNVNKLIMNKEINSHEDLQNHYVNEINRVIQETDFLEVRNKVYPIELGDSLHSFKRNNNIALYTNISRWNSFFFKDLKQYLLKTESAEFQIKNLFHIKNFIIDMKNEIFDKIVEEEKMIQESLEEHQYERKKIENIIGSLDDDTNKNGLVNKISKLEEDLKYILPLKEYGFFKFDFENINSKDIRKEQKKSIVNDKMFPSKFPEDCKFEAPTKFQEVNKEYYRYLTRVNKSVSQNIQYWEKKLNELFGLGYYFQFKELKKDLVKQSKEYNIATNYTRFRKMVKYDPYSEPIQKLKDSLSASAKVDINIGYDSIYNIYTSHKILLKEQKVKLKSLDKLIKAELDKLADLEKRESIAKVEWDKEVILGDKLDKILITAFNKEFKQLRYDYDNADENLRIIKLVEMNLIMKQIERLLQYGSRTKKLDL